MRTSIHMVLPCLVPTQYTGVRLLDKKIQYIAGSSSVIHITARLMGNGATRYASDYRSGVLSLIDHVLGQWTRGGVERTRA
jgi:hypothetical protein